MSSIQKYNLYELRNVLSPDGLFFVLNELKELIGIQTKTNLSFKPDAQKMYSTLVEPSKGRSYLDEEYFYDLWPGYRCSQWFGNNNNSVIVHNFFATEQTGIENVIVFIEKDKAELFKNIINQSLLNGTLSDYKNHKIFNGLNSINYHDRGFYNEEGYYICNPIDELENNFGIKVPSTEQEGLERVELEEKDVPIYPKFLVDNKLEKELAVKKKGGQKVVDEEKLKAFKTKIEVYKKLIGLTTDKYLADSPKSE